MQSIIQSICLWEHFAQYEFNYYNRYTDKVNSYVYSNAQLKYETYNYIICIWTQCAIVTKSAKFDGIVPMGGAKTA